MYKLTVYIPETHLEQVKDALFEAGAGRYDHYDRCCWEVRGHGQFRPLAGSHPSIGTQDETTRVVEYRVEMLCPDELIPAAIQAITTSHPYEEPAFDFTKIR